MQEEEEKEKAGWLKGGEKGRNERREAVGLQKMGSKEQETWIGEGEERRGKREQKGRRKREGGRDKKLGRVPGSIPPLLSRPSWAATFSHLCNIINEKAFRRDGGLDSGFRLWPTPADAAKPSRTLLELIGCHFQVQGTRQFIFFFHLLFPQNQWKPENNSHKSPEYYQAEKQDC